MERRFAHGAFWRMQKQRERGVAEFDLFALFVFHQAEFQIGVGQLAKGVIGGFGHLGLHRQ